MIITTCHLGIDMGGSDIKAVLLDSYFIPLKKYCWTEKSNVFTRDMKPSDWINIISKGIEDVKIDVANIKNGNLETIGISTPGIPNKSYSAINHLPARLQGLEKLIWSEHLPFEGQIPVINDAKAALLGELQNSSFSSCRNILMFTFGTGVGGAAIVDGHLLEGHFGRFGHFGHSSIDYEGALSIVGTPGALDTHIGNCFISERTYGLYNNPKSLLESHRKGDLVATEFWLKMVKAAAVGICSLINILDPEKVIIGGGIAKAGDDLFIPLKQYMDIFEWRIDGTGVELIPATQEDFAGAIGAAVFAYKRKQDISGNSFYTKNN